MKCSEFMKLIDLYLDGELDDAERSAFEAHAQSCASCCDELAAAKKLADILSHMDDNIAVPLPAQAAWRGTVRREAARRRMRRLAAAAGAVAAAVVLTLGAAAMVHSGGLRQQPVVNSVTMVAADGVDQLPTQEPEAQMMTMRSMPSPYAERVIVCEDAEEAAGYVRDIIAEYGGMIENESVDTDAARIYVQIPGEHVQDFCSAVDHVGVRAESGAANAGAGAVSVGVCIVIREDAE